MGLNAFRSPTARFPDPKSRPSDLGTETDSNTNQLLCYHTLGTPQVGRRCGAAVWVGGVMRWAATSRGARRPSSRPRCRQAGGGGLPAATTRSAHARSNGWEGASP